MQAPIRRRSASPLWKSRHDVGGESSVVSWSSSTCSPCWARIAAGSGGGPVRPSRVVGSGNSFLGGARPVRPGWVVGSGYSFLGGAGPVGPSWVVGSGNSLLGGARPVGPSRVISRRGSSFLDIAGPAARPGRVVGSGSGLLGAGPGGIIPRRGASRLPVRARGRSPGGDGRGGRGVGGTIIGPRAPDVVARGS